VLVLVLVLVLLLLLLLLLELVVHWRWPSSWWPLAVSMRVRVLALLIYWRRL